MKKIIVSITILMVLCMVAVAGSAETVAHGEPIKTSIGNKIETPSLIITLDKTVSLQELRFTEKETGSLPYSLSKDNQDATYIAIRGTIKNISKESVYLNDILIGNAVIDGYNYETRAYSYAFSVDPLGTKPFYLYALVPNELAKKYKSCVFTFASTEGVEYMDVFTYGVDACKYIYSVTLK